MNHGAGDVPLETLSDIAKAVVRIHVVGSRGTGFFAHFEELGLDGLLTNNHVLVQRYFDGDEFRIYTNDQPGALNEMTYQVKRGQFAVTAPDDLDFTFIGMTRRQIGREVKFLDVRREFGVGDYVRIVGHPRGRGVALGDAQKIVGMEGSNVTYLTDTEPGSSGSPVLNQDFKAIALNKSHDETANYGTAIGRIIERIVTAKRQPRRLAASRAENSVLQTEVSPLGAEVSALREIALRNEIIPGSLASVYWPVLKEWLGATRPLLLLWRSSDPSDVAGFHGACDGWSNTLVVVRSKRTRSSGGSRSLRGAARASGRTT
jgi:hypothetical protein